MQRKNSRTTAEVIRHNFIILFTCFALLTGASVVIVVGINLVHQRQTESIELLKSLNRSFIDDKPDWNQWRKNSSINTQDTYVRVTDRTHSANQPKVFYSKGTKLFLSLKQTQLSKKLHLPFFPALIYTKHYGVLYYRSGERHGRHKNIRSEIWLSLNPIVTTLASVIFVVLIILILSLVLGWFVISLVAKRLTRSLEMLQRTAREHSQSVVNIENLLPVPDSPSESRTFDQFQRIIKCHY